MSSQIETPAFRPGDLPGESGVVAGGEIAILVKDPVIGEEDLVVGRLPLPA